MHDLNVKKLNKLIDEFAKEGKNPDKLEIGYKTYVRLAEDDKFFNRVTKSEDSLTRFYKKIKIELVTEKHYLKIS